MRFLLCRTDHIGDLVVSLPVQNCILDNDPSAEVFWLVRPEVAPILEHLPGVSGVLHKSPDSDLERLIKDVKPDVLLNLGYRDKENILAAKRAGVPCRVGRCRGLKQILSATHIVWSKRTGKHESRCAMDFLKRLKWPVPESIPPPKLVLTQEEIARGKAELQSFTPEISPRLGVITMGKTCLAPSRQWWKKMLEDSKVASWNPVILSPPGESILPPTDLRGLMSRLYACDAVLGVSTGPTHLAAALNVPTLCLMAKSMRDGLARWTPMGSYVKAIQYPGKEYDLESGMDRFKSDEVLACLDNLRRKH